jgi:hypothetical protein
MNFSCHLERNGAERNAVERSLTVLRGSSLALAAVREAGPSAPLRCAQDDRESILHSEGCAQDDKPLGRGLAIAALLV